VTEHRRDASGAANDEIQGTDAAVGSETSFGHLTLAHPQLWAQHVGEHMRWLPGENFSFGQGAVQRANAVPCEQKSRAS
jgi:hypothetical protein